jgi:TolB protein
MRNKLTFALSVILLAAVPQAHAQREISLEISQTGAPKIRLALPAAVEKNLLPRDRFTLDQARGVLINDLNLSDLVRVETAQGDSTQVFVESLVSSTATGVYYRATLYSLPKRDVIGARGYRFEAAAARRAIHRLADDIIFLLTGEPGIASTQIAYVGTGGGSKEIYVVDTDGENAHRITAEQSLTLAPAWAPGGRVGFTSYARGNPDLYTVGADARGRTLVSSRPGLNYSCAWDPTGRQMALVLTKDGNSEIYVGDAAGGDLHRLTRNRAVDTSPAWSPDGRQLAFTSDRSGSPQIWIHDFASGSDRRLTLEGEYNDSATWSPKGDYIAYATRHGSVFRIAIIRVSDGASTEITSGPGSDEDPSFAPDGRHIVFSSSRSGHREVYSMLLDGSGVRQVTKGRGEKYSPAWSPREAGLGVQSD